MRYYFFLAVFILTIISSCRQTATKYIYNKGFVYGTLYSIIYESPDGKDFQEEIEKKFNEYTLIFSTYEKESTISKINRNEEVTPEPEFIRCFESAMEISAVTGGAFDITAGSMINAWGFGPEKRAGMNEELIEHLKCITGYEKVKLEKGRIVKTIPEIQLDMNAISKGYTSDLIARFLEEKGCSNYMVEIGGEVAAKGKNEKGKIWAIGISKPDEDIIASQTELQAVIHLGNKAMATSGNYRNFYVENGKKYAHTIDPKTGYPVQHSLLSATVISNECMTADAYATAFMVMGMELGMEIARQVPEIEVYFIYSDEKGNFQVSMSENFESYLAD